MSILNIDRMKVASTEATVDFLKYIPAEKLKQLIVVIIKRDGLTFAEEDFIAKVTNEFTNSSKGA